MFENLYYIIWNVSFDSFNNGKGHTLKNNIYYKIFSFIDSLHDVFVKEDYYV